MASVKPENFGLSLDKIIKDFSFESKSTANYVINKAVSKTWGDIIEQTPIGINEKTEGSTRGSWIVARSVSRKKGRRSKTKGYRYVMRNLPKRILGTKVYLFSNAPNIRMLEYGGYVKKPKLGTWNKKTGKYEIRTVNGFSKQAPKGMIRKNTMKFRTNLKNQIRLG